MALLKKQWNRMLHFNMLSARHLCIGVQRKIMYADIGTDMHVLVDCFYNRARGKTPVSTLPGISILIQSHAINVIINFQLCLYIWPHIAPSIFQQNTSDIALNIIFNSTMFVPASILKTVSRDIFHSLNLYVV